jgi:hypothetical protein
MESVEEYGKQAGIIKIIPPKEWLVGILERLSLRLTWY